MQGTADTLSNRLWAGPHGTLFTASQFNGLFRWHVPGAD